MDNSTQKPLVLLHRAEVSWDDAFSIAQGIIPGETERARVETLWKYVFHDGVVYMVHDANDLIKKLYNATWFIDRTKCTISDYMSDFSKRAYIVYGVWLNFNTAEHFVADLISFGIVKVERVVSN